MYQRIRGQVIIRVPSHQASGWRSRPRPTTAAAASLQTTTLCKQMWRSQTWPLSLQGNQPWRRFPHDSLPSWRSWKHLSRFNILVTLFSLTWYTREILICLWFLNQTSKSAEGYTKIIHSIKFVPLSTGPSSACYCSEEPWLWAAPVLDLKKRNSCEP